MSTDAAPASGTPRALLGGVLLGLIAIAWILVVREDEFVEREEFFPEASAADVATWTDEWQARATPWLDVPDPPGDGRVVRRRYWLSRWSYDLEVRRRGARVVVAIAGIAPHEHGGGWAAYGEGRITGDSESFEGAVATFSWSCLGVRYRHASDGVGRLVFSDDGRSLTAVYMAWEAPTLWAKGYGRLRGDDETQPPYGTLRGQIPYTPALATLDRDARYEVGVRVVTPYGAPIQGALVQLKGHTKTRATTDAQGRASIAFEGKLAPWAQVVAAGAQGHRNQEVACFTGDAWPGLVAGGRAQEDITIELPLLDRTDHPAYVWANASPSVDPNDVMACGTCHPWHHDQWIQSRHARMADNGHVTWERARMRRSAPEAPDDCHGCHQPAHAAQDPDATWRPRGMQAGNHCDFCHKLDRVLDVDASGMLGAYALARPDPTTPTRPGSIQHVFGTAPDVTYAYMGASYHPLFEDGHLCAGCHQGGGRHAAGGVAKLDTYGEWQRWLTSLEDPRDGKSCQDCHMPAGGVVDSEGRQMDQMAWDALHRSAGEIHSHRFFGSEPPFAAEALTIDVDKRRDLDRGTWVVTVRVTNTGAGHKVPTGSWSKRVIVGVWAESEGKALRQLEGPRTWLQPDASTDVAYAPGDWRNPGGFVLGVRAASDPEGKQTAPPFWQVWRPEDIVDTRLKPGETRSATLVFEDPGKVPDVEVRVLHRRARLAKGLASLPWTARPYDPPPETLSTRIRR